MTRKLLHKTLRQYSLFSLLLIFISAPAFYFFTQKLFIDDADEALLLMKKEFVRYNQNNLTPASISAWNTYNRDTKITPINASLTDDSLCYQSFFDTLANEQEPYRVLYSPITIANEKYTLMARINLVESDDLVMNIVVLFCILIILLLVGFNVITQRLSHTLWQPFYNTLKQVAHFELDKNIIPTFLPNDTEEFTRLNQSIHTLLERNSSVYKNQKEFIENASHELQTPLATFQAKLDLLVQQIPLTEPLSQTLSSLQDALSRLHHINKNLLLLSKIDNASFNSSEVVDLEKIIQKQVSFLAQQADARNVDVQFKTTGSILVTGNATLLEIAIGNVLLNALRYNYEYGTITIQLDDKNLAVANTSKMKRLDDMLLFKRFGSPGNAGGNGLGLSIAKKICDLHGFALLYRHSTEHHIFEIQF